MKLKLSLLLIFCALLSNSQSRFNTEGLQVTRGDLEQNIYSKDSTANALVIFEMGNSYVDSNDFKLHISKHSTW